MKPIEHWIIIVKYLTKIHLSWTRAVPAILAIIFALTKMYLWELLLLAERPSSA